MKPIPNFQIKVALFSDGACSGNPGPGGWAYLLWETSQDWVLGESGYQEKSTNNQMEILSLTEGLKALHQKYENESIDIRIFSDSKYVIQGATEWSQGWEKRGWKTLAGEDVANQTLWKDLLKVLELHSQNRIHWNYVPGHSGVCGNEFVDEAAVLAYQEKCARKKLCEGSRKKIKDLEDLSLEIYPSTKTKSKSSKGKALYYLSLMNGKLEKHITWAECEARVKGKSGAKYQKVTKSSEENEILRSWGLKS